MASIILSFVGQRDPFAPNATEGSIVTLVKHLTATHHAIKNVFLLYSDGTKQNAIDTCQWLVSEVPPLTEDTIKLMAVSDAFSQDPVDPFLATQAAQTAVNQARVYQTEEDFLEFNASSGTPAMKTAWSVLQALGYASVRSHVWQVRDPREMRPDQVRVFYSDVNLLKNELDVKVIKQQIQDYNYSGAKTSLEQSSLTLPTVEALLNYGYYRISMNFDAAFSCLPSQRAMLDPCWITEISPLRQKDMKALLQEGYFNILIRLKNRKYADFLVGLFQLQEQILYYLVREKLGLKISGRVSERNQTWQIIQQADQGKLYQFLKSYRLPRGESLDLPRSINRYILQAIIEYDPQTQSLAPLLQELNHYCELRNDLVHGFGGVSEIDDQDKLLATLRKLMRQVVGIPDTNPFDSLNQQINDLLDQSLQTLVS